MKFLRALDEKFEEVFLVIVLVAMVLIIFLQIIMRFVFSNSLSWSEELARYLFLWINWVGAAYAVKTKSHIAIEAVKSRLPKVPQMALGVIVFLIWLGFSVFMTFKGGELLMRIIGMNQKSAAMLLPMGWAYASVPVGCGLMTLRLLQDGFGVLTSKTKEAAK